MLKDLYRRLLEDADERTAKSLDHAFNEIKIIKCSSCLPIL